MWEISTRRQLPNFLSTSRFLDLFVRSFIPEKNCSQTYVLPNRFAVHEQSSLRTGSLSAVISFYKSRTRTYQNVHFRYVSHYIYIYVIYISNSAVTFSMLTSNGMKINWLWPHIRVYLETGSWILVEEASFFPVVPITSRRFRYQNWEVCH
jgi:hypothetical protein